MSSMKAHPLSRAKEAQVLAVKFGMDQWGFIRILRGSALGIWNKWTTAPVEIPANITERPEKWFCHYLSPKTDDTEMIELGVLPFDSDEQLWAPPCFYPPDVFQNHYRIYFRGLFREANMNDVVSILRCERLEPVQLVERLRSLYSDGLLVQAPAPPISPCR